MSFKFKLSAKDRASAAFIEDAQQKLARAIYKAGRDKNMSQKQIADKLDINKSQISRLLNGNPNLTLRTLAEVSWALGLVPNLELEEPKTTRFQNWEHDLNQASTRGTSSPNSQTSLVFAPSSYTTATTPPSKSKASLNQ